MRLVFQLVLARKRRSIALCNVLCVEVANCVFLRTKGRLLLHKRSMCALAHATFRPGDSAISSSSVVRARDCDTLIRFFKLDRLLMVHGLRIGKLHILLLKSKSGRSSVTEDLLCVFVPLL